MAKAATTGYTVEDLDWLRDEIGVAHLELDPWGSLVVSPADDPHEIAAATLARQAIEQHDLHFEPPPLLVVEIASPSSRRADRGRKLADYRLGGAEKYLLVDLPSAFELHDFVAGTVVDTTGSIDLFVGDQALRFTLP